MMLFIVLAKGPSTHHQWEVIFRDEDYEKAKRFENGFDQINKGAGWRSSLMIESAARQIYGDSLIEKLLDDYDVRRKITEITLGKKPLT